MERAYLFVSNESGTENYQLLIDCEYISTNYDQTVERNQFFEEISNIFAQKILEVKYPVVFGILNGHKINLQTDKLEKLPKLEEMLEKQIAELICCKLIQNPVIKKFDPSLN